MPIRPDDVCRNKAAIIERAIRRVKQEYDFDPGLEDFTHIDALILNVERACQAAIDLAMHIVSREHLGMPQSNADCFRLLYRAGLITNDTMRNMVSMVGFRNIAIHEYQGLDTDIIHAIAREKWKSLVTFCLETGIKIEP
jgi:uncharacterized protein YutE (UPF0331/DUF86 family)